MELNFEWDEEKATLNIKRHGIRFEEAKTIFNDPRSITIFDETHSLHENRFIDLGLSENGHLLVVVYTERNEMICLISARKANQAESETYEHQTF